MIEIPFYKNILLFFQKPEINNSEIEEKENIEKSNNINIKGSVEVSIGVLKNKNKEVIEISKNTDYERNLFLYELGFTNLKRVKEFIITMNTVGNIENYNKIEKQYSKYKLEILNDEMLAIVKKEFDFKQVSNDKFDNFIPNIAIDILKLNYNNIQVDGVAYKLYRKYYKSDTPELIENNNDFIRINLHSLKKSLSDDNEYYNGGSFYYQIKRKNISVCFNNNNNKGMVLLEVEPKYYMIISEWSDIDGNKLEKLNFKDFIKTQD